MIGRTHMLAGGSLGALYAVQAGVGPHETIVTIGVATICALLPDIDQPQSTIGNKIPLIPTLIQNLFGHRTLTHSLTFNIPLAFFLLWVFPGFTPLLLPMFIGIMSHIVLDTMNIKGVRLLYPYKKYYRLIKIKTGGVVENGIVITLVGIAFYLSLVRNLPPL